MVSFTLKRNGAVVPFDKNKITSAVLKAMASVNNIDKAIASAVTEDVVYQIGDQEEISVEEIQEIVEDSLIKLAPISVAKSYIRHRASHTEIREIKEELDVKDDLKLGVNALALLNQRYLRTIDGKKETPSQMFKRVAKHIASVEPNGSRGVWEKRFYNLMANQIFLPNTPTLALSNIKNSNYLFACYTDRLKDDLSDIFQKVKDSAHIMKSGGGIGLDFSDLRPRGDLVGAVAGISSGAVSFMRVFDSTAEVIRQGSIRRGGCLGILNVDHADIYEFISCKDQEGVLSNFNISVGITDSFISAARNNDNFNLVNPRDGSVVTTVSARRLLQDIATHAHFNGEPGFIFVDTVDRSNPVPSQGKLVPNLCSEAFLIPKSACCLGSINLTKFVRGKKVAYESLAKTVYTATRFLDNVLDVSDYPLPENKEVSLRNRNIGLGVMGFADMLFMLEIPYGSEESYQVAGQIMKFINAEAKKASQNIAQEKGAFPAFHESFYKDEKPLRNAIRTLIAPTGSLSIIAECSGGAEPNFGIVFTKENILGGKIFVDINKVFEQVAKREGFYSSDLINKIIENEGKVTGIKEVPDKWQKVFITALELEPLQHVKMQASWQEYLDNAISKTCNLPYSATIDDVISVIFKAHELGCKGLTVYRNESRSKQVLRGKNVCPLCGKSLVFSEGCVHCSECGWGKCSL